MLKTLSAYIKLKKPPLPRLDDSTIESRQQINGLSGFCDSFFFSGFSSNGVFLIARLAFRDSSPAEFWFDISIPELGRITGVERCINDPSHIQSGPLVFECNEPGKTWLVRYKGRASVGGRKQSLIMELSFTPASGIIDCNASSDFWCAARYMSKENWTPEWLHIMSKRDILKYEQAGSIDGFVKTKDYHFELSLYSIRYHNYGYQVWGDVNRHTRLHALMDDGAFVNINIASYSFLSFTHSGYYFKKGRVRPIKSSGDFTGFPVANPANKTFLIPFRAAGMKKDFLKCSVNEVFVYNMGNGYRIYEGICDFESNTAGGIGICEFGYNKKLYR